MKTFAGDLVNEIKPGVSGLPHYIQVDALDDSEKIGNCISLQPDRSTNAQIGSHPQSSNRDYAIIVPIITRINQKQYIEALTALIDSIHIRYAS